jgi:hypothetical protein
MSASPKPHYDGFAAHLGEDFLPFSHMGVFTRVLPYVCCKCDRSEANAASFFLRALPLFTQFFLESESPMRDQKIKRKVEIKSYDFK